MVYTVNGVQYTRRKKIPVTGAGSGAQTDFQIKLAALWSAAMQAGFGDVRFTKADMQTLIDAWLESKVDSTSADIWVEFPNTPADGVEKIKAMGEEFDPQFHEALAHIPSELEDNKIAAVIQNGYTMNSKVIRPARVAVSNGEKPEEMKSKKKKKKNKV